MKISVIIKALNEERNIRRAIESALAAVEEVGSGEVILADSVSTDATIEIAKQYPITIVQLANPGERCCGIGAQLGFEVAQGEFVYILDGDMEFVEGFMPAAVAHLEANPELAGVGGHVVEMNLENQEFIGRAERGLSHMQAGRVDRLDMGGLYRRQALEEVGYFTNRNLSAYEEFELAARLASRGWQLQRLPLESVKHYGHTDESYALLKRRWRSRYAWGVGQLLRESVGRDHLPFVLTRLHVFRLYGVVIIWWLALVLIALAGVILSDISVILYSIILFLLPFLAMLIRKRSISGALYSVTSWQVFSAGLVAGFFQKRKFSADEPVDHVIL